MQESSYLDGKEDLLKHIKTIPAFKVFEESNLIKMLSLSKIRRYAPGEQIMREGAYDTWIYFLLSGSVRIVKGGKEIIKLKRYGDMFGEMSVIDGSSRSASIFAENDVMCLALDGSIIEHIDSAHRDSFFAILYRFISGVLAERLRVNNKELSRVKAELESYKKAARTYKKT